MNRSDLIEALVKETGVTKVAATQSVKVIFDTIKGGLKRGDSVAIAEVGTFSVAKRAARKGVNPRTGAPLKIAARKVVRFKPGLAMNTLVNGKAAAKRAAK